MPSWSIFFGAGCNHRALEHFSLWAALAQDGFVVSGSGFLPGDALCSQEKAKPPVLLPGTAIPIPIPPCWSCSFPRVSQPHHGRFMALWRDTRPGILCQKQHKRCACELPQLLPSLRLLPLPGALHKHGLGWFKALHTHSLWHRACLVFCSFQNSPLFFFLCAQDARRDCGDSPALGAAAHLSDPGAPKWAPAAPSRWFSQRGGSWIDVNWCKVFLSHVMIANKAMKCSQTPPVFSSSWLLLERSKLWQIKKDFSPAFTLW